MDIINQMRQELSALVDVRGIDKAILIVDISQKLDALDQEIAVNERRIKDLTAELEKGGDE